MFPSGIILIIMGKNVMFATAFRCNVIRHFGLLHCKMSPVRSTIANHKIPYALFGGPPRNEFCDWLNAPQINNLLRIEPITTFAARYVGPICSREHEHFVRGKCR